MGPEEHCSFAVGHGTPGGLHSDLWTTYSTQCKTHFKYTSRSQYIRRERECLGMESPTHHRVYHGLLMFPQLLIMVFGSLTRIFLRVIDIC